MPRDDTEIDLSEYVKKVFEDELERADKFLTEEELLILLKEEDGKAEIPRKSIVGYPTYPLYREVANMLNLWLKQKHCPALDLPSFDLLDEKSYTEERATTIKSITPLLFGLETLWTFWTIPEIEYRVREILLLLGLRGILDLLGVRKTVGTINLLPPSRTSLINSFTAKHSPNSELWVGARALSKHYHRDHSDLWWGNCTGSDAAKNEHAMGLLTKILDNAVWINVHWLPHDVFIIEARQDQGYGMRWSADGSNFRGFLEPQMVDGHELITAGLPGVGVTVIFQNLGYSRKNITAQDSAVDRVRLVSYGGYGAGRSESNGKLLNVSCLEINNSSKMLMLM